MRATKILLFCATCLTLIACDSDPTTDGGNADSGPGDAGPMGVDSGPRTDAGPGDPCAASMANAISSLGCNGGIFGSTEMDNQIGGACTPDGADPPGAGTCTASGGASMPVCIPDDAMPTMGTCIFACPSVASYVSTGGCPSGSRCFSLMDVSICFRDCNTAADCFTDEMCDAEGSCVRPPPADGGVPTTDGGTPTTDGGAPASDAGVSADAG